MSKLSPFTYPILIFSPPEYPAEACIVTFGTPCISYVVSSTIVTEENTLLL